MDNAKKPRKYVLCTGFGTEKYAPFTDFYAPGTGYTLGYVQNTYFVRTLYVLFTYFGVRLERCNSDVGITCHNVRALTFVSFQTC